MTQTRTASVGRPDRPHETHVQRYFAACSTGTADDIAACFTDSAVVYDLNHRPVRGAEGIGAFYVRVRDQWNGALWEVNSYLEQGGAAAIEWTMRGTADGEDFAMRGSEHYEFAAGLIAQIRQYWRFDPSSPSAALRDYPYESDTRFALKEG
jgi:ketosteroid isomerase-like protein